MLGLMLFMFLFFLGSMAMFFYLLRRLETLTRGLNDEHAQLRVLLRAMESRIEKMTQSERLPAGLYQGEMESSNATASMDGTEYQPQRPAQDPLLHLSFDPPSPIGDNVGQKLDITPEARNWDLDMGGEQK